MSIQLEHANLCVRDVDETLRFLQAAFPEFIIRYDKTSAEDERWVHVGTDTTYIALSVATKTLSKDWIPYSGFPGVNHLAYVVDSIEDIRVRLHKAGYKDSTIDNNHPFRKRLYFHDSEGNDWEFVEYLSNNFDERNDYKLAE